MWCLKVSFPSNEGMLVASRAKRHNIAMMAFPLSNYTKKNKFYLTCAGYIVGDSKNKKEFVKDLKKDSRTQNIEQMDENFYLFLMEQHPSAAIFYDPLIISIKPFYISKTGEQTFELASWDKNKLMNIAKLIQTKLYKGKVEWMKQLKIKNVFIKTALPELTDKQREAFELAVRNGYYGYPRKTSLVKLSKIMKLSYSTYEFHLRNAEKKLMPYLYSIN